MSFKKDFDLAIRNRNVRFFRFDNSSYWKSYYQKKLEENDISREKNYSCLLRSFLPSRAKVLDIACGLGVLSVELKRVGLDVKAIDLFGEMIRNTKEYFKKNKVKIPINKEDAVSMSFKDNFFDAVCGISIIEHFTKQEIIVDFLPEVRRVLKKNGLLLVHMPIRTPFSFAIRFFRRYLSRDLPKWAIDDDGDVTHKVWLSLKEYQKIIENAGFEILDFCFYCTRSNRKPKLLWNIGKIIEKMIKSNFDCRKKSLDRKKSNQKNWWPESYVAVTGDFLCRKI